MPFENSGAFRHLVDVFVSEAHLHGWDVSEVAAEKILARRVDGAATLLRIQPDSVLRTYLGEVEVRAMARDLVPVAAAEGATGRDDEPPVDVPVALVGKLVADLGQAGRFAASHGHHMPEAGLHNLVADACVIVGLALSTPAGGRVLVPGYGLRLARRALYLVAEGIDSGWVLALKEPAGPRNLDEMTAGVRARMQEMQALITELLPALPPLKAHEPHR